MDYLSKYAVFTDRNIEYIAYIEEYSIEYPGMVTIVIHDGRKFLTNLANLRPIDYFVEPGDFLSVVDFALDTNDEEWFKELYEYYIKYIGVM